MKKYKELVFLNVDGREIPLQPWPQRFIVTQQWIENDKLEIRPITLTGIVKAICQNFISMNWFRIKKLLNWIGFIDTPEGYSEVSFRYWRWDFWNTLYERRYMRHRQEIKRINEGKFSEEWIKKFTNDFNRKLRQDNLNNEINKQKN
jgi:hypothetical protein